MKIVDIKSPLPAMSIKINKLIAAKIVQKNIIKQAALSAKCKNINIRFEEQK